LRKPYFKNYPSGAFPNGDFAISSDDKQEGNRVYWVGAAFLDLLRER